MEINNALRQLNQITINNQAYPITKLLGGDMKYNPYFNGVIINQGAEIVTKMLRIINNVYIPNKLINIVTI